MNNDISVEELRDLLDSEQEIVLIDVREDYEYDEDNLGGKLIPLGDLPGFLPELEGLKETDIYVHCRSGKRSDTAKKFMEARGFTKVHNVLGGIIAYRQMEEN